MNAVSKVATKWFGDHERALATSIAALSNPIGGILGMGLGSFFVKNEDTKNHE